METSAPKAFPGHFNKNTMDITIIIEKVPLKAEKKCSASHTSPHGEDEAWESLYDGIKFYDDMNPR